jgi:UPF0716 family protein affecting phage T7 exclusion
VKRDIEQLQLLMIFHFILAAILAFLSLFPLFYVFAGIMILTSPPPPPAPGGPAMPPNFTTTVGWTVIAIGGIPALLGFIETILLLIAGICLWRRKGYGFCFAVACITCVVPPLLGTALGVCSILVLVRRTVKDLFSGRLIVGPDPEDENDEGPPRARRRSDRFEDDRFSWRE